MRSIAFLFIVFSFISCNNSENSDNSNKEEKEFVFDMYEPSEMTLLMRSMYEVHEELKKEIVAGNTPDKFPKDFLNIYTATLTDEKPKNEIFKAYSKVFIDNEREMFFASSELPLKQRYNTAINTCISCHSTECVGPITRIEKLLIN